MTPTLTISKAAREARDRIGLVCGSRTYTFADLDAGAATTRLVMLEQGAAILVAERDIHSVLTLYAALESRTPLVLVHPRATAAERDHLLFLIENHAGALAGASTASADLAVVLFTSGTTGASRGVLLDRGAFVASAAASAAHLGWHPDDRWLCCLPLAHIGGLSILTRCLIARQCVVLSQGEHFDPGRVADEVTRHRVTLMSLVPTMLDALLDAGWTAPEHVRAVLLGGAAAPASLLERAAERGVPALVTYGMTETCSQVCTQRPGTGPAEPGHIGPPLSGVGVRIGDSGRIQVRGRMLFRGYLGAAPAVDEDGWFDTGDRGWIDDSGDLHMLGRADDLIITGGENVHPSEVEDALTAYPDIVAACVFGVSDATWGQLVAAAVVCGDSPGKPVDRTELARFLASRLATYKRPRLYCELPELPLGPSGKVARDRVAAQAASVLRPLSYPR